MIIWPNCFLRTFYMLFSIQLTLRKSQKKFCWNLFDLQFYFDWTIMSFEADRESFFEKLNSEIMNVAKKGFPALSFLVSLKKQSVHRFPIPETSRSNLNSYSNINIDRISS